MGFRINTNVLSLSSQRNLSISNKAYRQALERLSSGSRINRAGDDAAGLAISEGLQAQVRGTRVAIRNANDAVGFLNTAEGALQELTNISQRLRELAIQASNGTLGASDRGYLNAEKNQLVEEFDRIASQTNFNGSFLLDGSFTTTNLQVGTSKGQTIAFNIGNAKASQLGALATISGVRGTMINTGGVVSLIINGVSVDASEATDDSYSSNGKSYSAIALAKVINEKSGSTAVFADVQTTIVQLNNLNFSAYNGSLATDKFTLNNIAITGTGINSVNSFVAAVNNFSNQTGVKARLQSGSTDDIELYSDDGRNMQIQWSNNAAVSSSSFYEVVNDSANASSAAISTGVVFTQAALSSQNWDITRTGSIKLRSASAITVTGTNTSNALGHSTTSVAVDPSQALNSISLTTQNLASDSLSVVDATLAQLNSLRSSLGATQSRLDSVVNNLSITLENISSARSQIRDADVAQETAELSRAQILQQAGIAVLGQANTSSQSALQLLQNL